MKIIILHGWKHNREMWKKMTARLGKDALALDLPGFGKEPLIDINWNIKDYAEWVYKRILKYKDIVLIGHSFGGRIAVEIASKYPKEIKGLILSGAPCISRPSASTLIKIRISKILKLFIPLPFRKMFYSGDLKQAGNLEYIFRNVVQYDQTSQLRGIKIPTLLIWGGKDSEVPLKIAIEINKLIRDSKLKVIDNAGHNSFLEKPDLFYGYVKNFISHL